MPALVELTPSDKEHFSNNNPEVRTLLDVDIATALAHVPPNTDAVASALVAGIDAIEDTVKEVDKQMRASSVGKPVESIPNDINIMTDARVARRSIIRLLHMAGRQVPSGFVIDSSLISPESNNLLREIDDKIQNNLNESSAVILFPMIQKLARNTALTRAEIEAEFDRMQGRMAAQTLKKIGEAIVARSADYGMAPADAQVRFVDNVVDQVGGALHETGRPLTPTEQARFDHLQDEINQHLNATIADPATRIRELNLLKDAISRRDTAEVMRRLGWPQAKVEELFKLDRNVRGQVKDDLSRYGIMPEDLVIFDPRHIEQNFSSYFERRDGKWQVKEEFHQQLIKSIYENTNKLLQKASANPNSDWKDHFTDMYEGRIVRELKDIVTAIADDERLLQRFGGDVASERALRDIVYGASSEVDMEISMREALHTIRGVILYNRAGTKEIAGFIKAKFPASTITNMIHAFRGPLVGLARDQVVEYVKERLLENNGVIPADLFGSIFDAQNRYNQPDQRNLRDDYIEKLEIMKNDPELRSLNPELYRLLQEPMEPWMHEREIALGLTIALIADMRIIEELATAKASPDFAGGIVEFMAAFGFQPRIMRGPVINELPGLLRTIVPITEEQRQKRRRKRHHNPLTWHLKTRNKIARDVGYDTIDQEADEGVTFVNAIRDVASFSNQSKGSWRNASIKLWAKNEGTPIGGSAEEWRNAYDNLLRKAGVGSRWGLDKLRVDDEVKHVRLSQRYPNYKSRYTSAQINVLWANMNRAVTWDKMSAEEARWERFKLQKVRCYQGMNFLALLDRAPGDFIVRLATLEPEIMATKKNASDEPISAYEFYFGSEGKLNSVQKQDRKAYIEKLEYKWGRDNVDHIARVMQYWDNAYKHYNTSRLQADIETDLIAKFKAKENRDPDNEEREKLHKKAINQAFSKATNQAHRRTYKVMGAALGSVKMKNKSRMDENDVIGGSSEEQDFFRRQFLMNGGLQGYFHGLNEKFGDQKGQEGQLGDKGFFYTLAARWCDIEERKIIPSTSDIRLEPQYDNIAQLGESALFRQMDDPEGFSEAIKTLPIIDQLFRAESRGDPKQMTELLESIKTLAGKEGNDGMWKAMWTVLFPRLEFFQRTGHGIADPFFNENIASDSKLAFGPNSVHYVTEQLRMLAIDCGNKGLLPWKGPYSVESLMYVLRIDTKTYVAFEVFPTALMIFIFMFLSQQALKAYEQEFELSQKKAA